MGNYTADIGTFADLNSGERFFFTGYWQSNGIKFYNTEAFSITGGSGHDNLVGGADADVLIGGAGHDNLDGGSGDDMLSGGDGNDVLIGGAGNDTFEGGAGTDSAQFGVASTDITVGHNGTALVITSSEGVDQVEFGVENLIFSDTTLRFAQAEGLIPGDQVSTFDFGTEGWTTSNGTETFDATTGNSGGSVRGTEGGSGVWTFIAPPSFLGDQGRYYGGTLSFDLRQDSDASQYFDNDVTLRGTGLTLVADLGDNPMTDWTSYSIDLELGAGWRIGSLSGRIATGQEIQSVLSDLEAFTIRGEFVDGAIDDASNLDNVSLVVGPPPPDYTGGPTITSTFDTDIEGWSFIADVREFRHAIDGGNPGGYLEGVDYTTGETWYFVAAEKYLGDKSAYFGGSLSFDLKQSELSSQFNNDDVVLIGSTVTIVHNILRPETDWTSYTLNLDTRADWRIGSETGEVATEAQIQEALASLQTLRIRGEYVSGSDTGGLDNVVLQSANVATVYSTPDRVHALASFASVQGALNTAEAGQAVQITGDLPIAAAYVPVNGLTVFADAPFAMGLTLGTNVTAISLGGSATLTVAGTDAGDQISGSDGANALRGYAGNDTLLGNAGADTVFGGVDNDFLAGGVGDDAVYGEDGNDTIYLGLGNDIGGGGAGNDAIYGGAGANAIWGGLGDDTVQGGIGNDSVYGGGQGTNQLFGNDGADLIYTGAGGDFVGGGSGNDVIRGGDGADTIYGGIGDNNVGGGGGDDFLRMAEGNDTVYGGLGDDNIGAGAGNDLIIDGAGNNVIWGGLGSDTVQGGAGQDTIYGGGDGANQLLGNGGNDVIWGGAGNDFIGGGTGNDEIYGDAGNDTIFAGMGNDFIGGGAGDDLIYGSGGDNRVYLGVGNDTFIAGTNKDIVTGGPGTDVFVFQSAAQIGIGSGRDSITDFIHGEDKIDISSLNTQFNGTSGFLGGSDSSFFYFPAGGLLIGDADGNGIVDWVLELGGAPAVAMDDFIL
jgi:Ca2+-binding RTX toxin-like protein